MIEHSGTPMNKYIIITSRVFFEQCDIPIDICIQ